MRDSKLIKLLCLILSLFMAISLLGACDFGGNQNDVSSDASSDVDVDVEPSEDEDTDDDESDEESDSIEDTEEDEEEESPVDNYFYRDLYVYNKEAPINNKYRGVSSTVYHAFGHMKDDKTGRVYTDEMMELELNRLQDSGVHFARTRYTTQWLWDGTIGGWNFEGAPRINYFYEYCNNLAKRDINVVMSVGWHLGCFTHIESGSIDEHAYITKSEQYPNDLYGETAGYDFSKCKNEEYARYAKESLRLGYAHAQLLKYTKALGINNITHFLYFTEPSYSTSMVGPIKDSSHPAYGYEGPTPDEYIFIVQTIQQKLKEEGVYDWVQHVGPNQGSIKHGDGLLRYILERGHTDMFDVWTAHFYPQAPEATNNVYYDVINPVFESYVQPLKDVGIFKNEGVEFWVDEFYCRADNSKLGVDNAWVGLQMVVGGICAQQMGINNISLWQIFDQLWTDQTNTGGEFIDGIHACGSAPSLFISSIPRRQYYSTGLFARYNGYKNGKAYRTNNDDLQALADDIHIGAAQLEDGSWTITVVNAGIDTYDFTVHFDKAIYQTLYRHVNNVNTNIASTAAHLADPDKTFANVKDKFTDKIEGGCVAIYTGLKY